MCNPYWAIPLLRLRRNTTLRGWWLGPSSWNPLSERRSNRENQRYPYATVNSIHQFNARPLDDLNMEAGGVEPVPVVDTPQVIDFTFGQII
jgi:hypothetical protein